MSVTFFFFQFKDSMAFSNFLLLSFLLVYAVGGLAASTIDVDEHGAIGDGNTDDTNAIINAWNLACADQGSPTLLFPTSKTFLSSPVILRGPCKSPIHVQVDGNIVAPNRMWSMSGSQAWIVFSDINGINIDGSGQIDGNGAVWWPCRISGQCPSAPTSVAFEGCNNLNLSSLKFINSPQKHITINNGVGVHISGLTITAPENSPNTDGIHIEKSQHLEIKSSTIGTGDDCVSIGTGTVDLNISNIACGPGHGISIGSLGDDGSQATVEQIHVSYCNFYSTMNGVRIKTWQGGSGYARGITFNQINFTSVSRPVIIDQYYCGGGSNCPTKPSGVKVSDVSYVGLQGSLKGLLAISLNCSQSVACEGIFMQNIDIYSVGGGPSPVAVCTNAFGTKQPQISPPVPCLT